MNRRYRKKRNDETVLPTISLTPLIDTVLVLLVIFMVTTPGKTTVSTAPAERSNSNYAREQVTTIEIASNGDIYCDRKRVTFSQLPDEIRARNQKNSYKNTSRKNHSDVLNVLVHAEDGSPSKVVTQVVDAIRQMNNVGILVG